MPVRTIYIARHGFDSSWETRKSGNGATGEEEQEEEEILIPPTGIHTDTTLSSHGVLQSKELAHYLLSLDTQPDVVVSSPFYRCVETAMYSARLLEVPLLVDQGLGEWYDSSKANENEEEPEDGNDNDADEEEAMMDGNGGVYIPADVETLNKLFRDGIRDDWHAGVDPYHDSEGNVKRESQQDLFARCRLFLDALNGQLNEHYPDAETILLMTHAPVKVSLGLNLLGMKKCTDTINNEKGNTIRCGSCSLDKYEMVATSPHTNEEEEQGENDGETVKSVIKYEWKITMNGNTIFLRNGEEKNWEFTDVKNKNDGTLMGNSEASAEDSSEKGNTEQQEEMEMETVYISLDLSSGSYREKLEIDRNATFQYSGLDQEKPLFRIGDKLYEGEWQQLVGTEFAFPNEASIHKRGTEGGDQEGEGEESAIEAHSKQPVADKLIKEEPQDDTFNSSLDTTEHGEVIYRIKNRLALQGLHPV